LPLSTKQTEFLSSKLPLSCEFISNYSINITFSLEEDVEVFEDVVLIDLDLMFTPRISVEVMQLLKNNGLEPEASLYMNVTKQHLFEIYKEFALHDGLPQSKINKIM
jgi:hypothetical protein